MKKPISILFFIGCLSLFSCQQEAQENTDLNKLKAQRDSLRIEKNNITQSLLQIEQKIADLDENQKLNLVTTVPVFSKRFEHFVVTHGVIETDEMAMINAETQGRIMEIKTKAGSKVSKGEVLAVLNADIIKKNIEELETRLELAKTLFERQERLWNQNVGSEVQFLQAKTEKEALENALVTANEQLALSVVKAPFSGTIDEVFMKAGEMTGPGNPLFRLVNLDKMFIRSDISEKFAGLLTVGDTVIVQFPYMENKSSKAVVGQIGSFINPNNRTFKIKVNLLPNELSLKPNMLAELYVRDYVNNQSIALPEDLVQQGAGNSFYVYVAEKNGEQTAIVEKKILEIGLTYNNQIEIKKGLKNGDLIVAKGARSIRDGELVKVVEAVL